MPLDAAALATAIRAAKLTSVHRTFYRSVDLTLVRQLGLRMLDGAHAGITGNRYNSPNTEPIAYLAGSQTVAALECEQASYIMGVGSQTPNPRLTVAITVASTHILDLTNPVVLANLGVVRDQLLIPTLQWQHVNSLGGVADPQLVGDLARERADVDGLLVPSWVLELLPPNTLPPSPNLVLFMEPRAPATPRGQTHGTTTLRVHDPTGLVP